MLEISSIAEFSRSHCVSICAVFIPLNLCVAGGTTLLVVSNRSPRLLYSTVGISLLPAIVLLLHVATWWSIGVVMLPTFILPALAMVCLVNNAYAVIAPQHMRKLAISIWEFSVAKYQQLVAN